MKKKDNLIFLFKGKEEGMKFLEKSSFDLKSKFGYSKKCFRQGCHKQILDGCSHNQCSYHHNELCVKKGHSDTMHGYCQLLKVKRLGE